VTWWEYRTPRSSAADRPAPHSQVPAGKSWTVSSGSSFRARCAPGAPGCLPGLRLFPPRGGLGFGSCLPGRSSLPGGIKELPEFREINRSSRASLAFSPAFPACSSAFCARSSAFGACNAASAASASGVSGTPVLHHSRPEASKSTRSAGQSHE
jgi:hypothetical protein